MIRAIPLQSVGPTSRSPSIGARMSDGFVTVRWRNEFKLDLSIRWRSEQSRFARRFGFPLKPARILRRLALFRNRLIVNLGLLRNCASEEETSCENRCIYCSWLRGFLAQPFKVAIKTSGNERRKLEGNKCCFWVFPNGAPLKVHQHRFYRDEKAVNSSSRNRALFC